MNQNEKNAVRNEYAKTLREIADIDYIGARTLFRNRCFDQFLYYSHQCLEKYLKSTLLFNDIKRGKTIKNVGHDLSGLSELSCKINHLDIPTDTKNFVEHLDSTYFARYLSAPFFATKNYLNLLDQTVWWIRIYAQNDTTKIISLKKLLKTKKKSYIKTNAIFSGMLEKIFINKDRKYDILKKNLIWRNPYYGTQGLTENEAKGFWAKSPIFFQGNKRWQIECYDYLKDYIHFENEIHEHFKKLKKTTR